MLKSKPKQTIFSSISGYNQTIFKRKIILFIIVVLFLSLLVKNFTPKEEKRTVIKVKSADITQTINASGKIIAESQANLKFPTAGKLVWVGVKEGDEVKKWQALASLDKRSIEQNIRKKLLTYMTERWDFEQTQSDYKTKKEIFTLTDAEKRILEKAQFDLDSAVVDVEIADLAREQAVLYSPIKGIVTRIDMPIAGVNITADQTITVADPETMTFLANVDETDIGLVSLGLEAEIILDAYPEKFFFGQVKEIGFSSITTSGGGVAFPVKVSLPVNEGRRFKIGMNGDTEIITKKKSHVLVIPQESVIEEEDKSFVWLIKDGRAKKQEIKIGITSDEQVEVTEGLQEGDKIIKNVLPNIKDDQKINYEEE